MGGYMLYFIVNEKSKSGNAKQIWKEIEEVLKVRNVSYQAFVSEYRGHAGKLAAEICAMDDNDICLVAVGGDGTANEVINGITDFEKVRFGVIPTGSGNDLARGLLLSKDPKNGAIHILNAMKKSREDTWCMDLGEVNFGEEKRLFAISAGIGLDALVCKKALKSTIKDILNKIRLGKLTYLVLTVQSLFTMQTADAEIFFDREEGLQKKRMIFTAAMNYVLIVISTLINRTKEVAVHKCYGASDKNLFGMIMSETCLHMLISLLLAAFLIVLFHTKTEELLGATLGALFSTQTIVILIGVCIVIFFITGLIPTYMFLRIPVAAAFRNFKESRRYWKLCLLFIQFLATAYLVALLSVINKQYDYMVNVDPGYAYEKLAYCSTQGVEESVRNTAIEELRKIPEVDKVSACYDLPISGMSGNNVSLPGDDRELFNIADMYWVKDDFFSLMEIPVIEGEVFRSDGSASNKVMVSRSFVEKMEQVAGWTGSAIGKNIIITEHSQNGEPFTICGVYEDVCIGSTGNPDTRPTALFYDRYAPMILIKFHEMSPENIKKAQKVLEDVMPDRNVTVTAYYMDMIDLYKDSRTFRDSVMIGGIVTLIIALIGLLGYTSDETNRRGREIAIRKVNGATAWSILKMISKDISYIAIPAIVIGMTVAYYSGTGWLEKFTEKAPIGFFIFLAGAMMVYVLIIACVLYRAWAVSNSNPVDSLKSE